MTESITCDECNKSIATRGIGRDWVEVKHMSLMGDTYHLCSWECFRKWSKRDKRKTFGLGLR